MARRLWLAVLLATTTGCVTTPEREPPHAHRALPPPTPPPVLPQTPEGRLDKQAEGFAPVAQTQRSPGRLTASMSSDKLFDEGSGDLRADAKQTVDHIAVIVVKYREDLIQLSESATDSDLGRRRAEAVKLELIASGVPASTISFASTTPSTPAQLTLQITADSSKL